MGADSSEIPRLEGQRGWCCRRVSPKAAWRQGPHLRGDLGLPLLKSSMDLGRHAHSVSNSTGLRANTSQKYCHNNTYTGA